LPNPQELPEERVDAQNAASAANAELESILSVSSHDLRGQLMTLQGFTQELELSRQELAALLPRPESAPQAISAAQIQRAQAILNWDITEAIAYLKGAAAQIECIATGLQSMTSLARMPFHIGDVDMNAVIAEAVSALHDRICRSQVSAKIEPLPGCRGDAAQLRLLFGYLLDNATSYVQPERPCRVRVTGRASAGFAIYCLADNGPGVAPAQALKAFELFRRFEPGTAPSQGMGLALARHIAVRHAGKIWIETGSEEGSRFFVSLPRGLPD
jgi:signal transduction histidine kinase